jgi:hypothetical protein
MTVRAFSPPSVLDGCNGREKHHVQIGPPPPVGLLRDKKKLLDLSADLDSVITAVVVVTITTPIIMINAFDVAVRYR